MRIKKSKQLGGTWELIRVCKSFLEEWENEWTESEQKSRMRQEERNQVLEKEERFKKIEKKKNEIKKKSVQTRIDFCISKLGKKGQEEFRVETRREKIEIQELRMNMWRWRENGGGRQNREKRSRMHQVRKVMRRNLNFWKRLLKEKRKRKRDAKS